MAGLESKVALMTGAGGMKGIGRATALKLAAQSADIAVTDVQRPPEELPPGELRQQWRSIDPAQLHVQLTRCPVRQNSIIQENLQ